MSSTIFDEARTKSKDDPQALQAIKLAEEIIQKAGTAATDPLTFVGIPHNQSVEFGTAKACLVECSEKIHLLTLQDYTSSLLAWSFNQLWCSALNARKFKYWLLCHSDISFRTPRFLDVMVDELERHNLDAIHVPMAIKDSRGITSSGVGNLDDEWGRIRRISVHELQKLPPTFMLDDAVSLLKKTGHVPTNPVFCPNTGVLLVKFGNWSWDFPGFNIRDRIVSKVHSDGSIHRYPQVIPEDWYFGMWMQKNGLKVGGCRRIRTSHWCKASFQNDAGWGQSFDEDYCNDPANWGSTTKEGKGVNHRGL